MQLTEKQNNTLSLAGWELINNFSAIEKRFQFPCFDEVMVFVVHVSEIAKTHNHHPDVCFGYDYCHLVYTTHSVGNLSKLDFICAAAIDKLGAKAPQSNAD